MQLKDPAKETDHSRVGCTALPDAVFDRAQIRQRRPHQIEEADVEKQIHSVGEDLATFDAREMKKPPGDSSGPAEKPDDKKKRGCE